MQSILFDDDMSRTNFWQIDYEVKKLILTFDLI